MSSPDKTSTTGTITEVKEFLEEVPPEKEQHDVDNIEGDKDLTGTNEIDKSANITLEDTTKLGIEETINAETEEHRQITSDDTTKLNSEETTSTETEDLKQVQK